MAGRSALRLALRAWRLVHHSIRRYVHDLETRCDPAGEVRQLFFAREEVAALRAEHERLTARATAAEGLLQTIADAKDSMAWWADLDRFLNAPAGRGAATKETP